MLYIRGGNVDEKTCSACGGSGWVADGNEANQEELEDRDIILKTQEGK